MHNTIASPMLHNCIMVICSFYNNSFLQKQSFRLFKSLDILHPYTHILQNRFIAILNGIDRGTGYTGISINTYDFNLGNLILLQNYWLFLYVPSCKSITSIAFAILFSLLNTGLSLDSTRPKMGIC